MYLKEETVVMTTDNVGQMILRINGTVVTTTFTEKETRKTCRKR